MRAEIRLYNQMIGSSSGFLQGFVHPRWWLAGFLKHQQLGPIFAMLVYLESDLNMLETPEKFPNTANMPAKIARGCPGEWVEVIRQ